MKRISGFDTGKGIAVLGMIIAHTFEGGICQWDYDVEINFFKRIPFVVVLLLSPLALILLMGLFFTFISSITCSISILHKEKDKKAVSFYIVYRMLFAVILKGMELICTALWKEYGIFETMKIQFPIVSIPRYSHTLDSVGVCGWVVPLLVYCVRAIPSIPTQVSVLSLIALVLLSFSNPIATFCLSVASFFQRYDMNGLSLIFSKIGSGPFMLAQTIPFGIVGGAVAILITEFPTTRELWLFDLFFSIGTVVTAGISLFFSEDFWGQVQFEMKPPAVRLMELLVELNIIVLGMYLLEDPRRSERQRMKLQRATVFLRRISIVSLTAFIFEQFVCWETFKLFYMFLGPAVNLDTKEYLWSIPVTLFYAIFTTACDLLIILVWEFAHFRFSCEYFIGAIMSFLFNQEYNRIEYEKIVYCSFVCSTHNSKLTVFNASCEEHA